MDLLTSDLINAHYKIKNIINLTERHYETTDSWIPLGQISMEGSFFVPLKTIQRKYYNKINPMELFDADIFLAQDITW